VPVRRGPLRATSRGLALSIFDGTKKQHRLAERERSILEYAALLHDVGHHISHIRHHRHSYYLIKNGDLRGFTPEEIEMLANVARYHRRGTPRRKHAGFASLLRGRVARRILAGFLKLADALDRSHRQTVRAVVVRPRRGTVRVVCLARGTSSSRCGGPAAPRSDRRDAGRSR